MQAAQAQSLSPTLRTGTIEDAEEFASEDGENLLTAFRRASNIVAIEERRDVRRYDGDIDPSLLRQPEERALVDSLGEVGGRAGTLLAREEFEKAMSELARLRRPIDDFFDKVTVNCGDAALRENRLRLLSRLCSTSYPGVARPSHQTPVRATGSRSSFGKHRKRYHRCSDSLHY